MMFLLQIERFVMGTDSYIPNSELRKENVARLKFTGNQILFDAIIRPRL
jgi:hypothetical protein